MVFQGLVRQRHNSGIRAVRWGALCQPLESGRAINCCRATACGVGAVDHQRVETAELAVGNSGRRGIGWTSRMRLGMAAKIHSNPIFILRWRAYTVGSLSRTIPTLPTSMSPRHGTIGASAWESTSDGCKRPVFDPAVPLCHRRSRLSFQTSYV